MSSWHMIRDEVADVLSAVSEAEMASAVALFEDAKRRWFCCGQGRSGLIASMAAMRLMHVGLCAHAVGEPTAPAIDAGDGLITISRSGETPVTLHIAKRAQHAGALILAVTANGDSSLSMLANVVIEVPAIETRQFAGSLFEQAALLLLDAVTLDLTGATARAYSSMQARHANLE